VLKASGKTSYSMAILMGEHAPRVLHPSSRDLQGGYSDKWRHKTFIHGYVTFDDTIYTAPGNTTPMRLEEGVDFRRAWQSIREGIALGNFRRAK
jgi:hypothetical protein